MIELVVVATRGQRSPIVGARWVEHLEVDLEGVSFASEYRLTVSNWSMSTPRVGDRFDMTLNPIEQP